MPATQYTGFTDAESVNNSKRSTLIYKDLNLYFTRNPVTSDVSTVTDVQDIKRAVRNIVLLNPGEKPEKSYVQECLSESDGPIIAASDYIRTYADQIRPYLSKPFYSFGTDGYGRSDSRKKLRKFFEVDKEHIVAYALSALAKEQLIPSKQAKKAMKKYSIDKDKPIPTEL